MPCLNPRLVLLLAAKVQTDRDGTQCRGATFRISPHSFSSGEAHVNAPKPCGQGLSQRVRVFLKTWVPPGAIRIARRLRNIFMPADWEYLPGGFGSVRGALGWNSLEMAEKQKQSWSAYLECVSGTGPLGINHEDGRGVGSLDLRQHNTLITYAYVLALAARMKSRLSILDWGAGLGHYALLSRAVLPGVELDYHCVDVPSFCQLGRELAPEAKFVEFANFAFDRKYDLVVASSSLWYEEDWKMALERLISAADPYLFITRMIFVESHPSFVAIQRPYALGYNSQYPCWILNRKEFLDQVSGRMNVIREFLVWEGPHIKGAPEQGDYHGFLFKRSEDIQTA